MNKDEIIALIKAKNIAELAAALQHVNISKLQFKAGEIDNEDVKVLAEALWYNTKITHLSLIGIGMMPYGVKAIANMLQHNSKIKYLNLMLNDIGNEGARYLSKSIGNLFVLNLSHNNILGYGVRYLAKSLESNKNLIWLDIWNNEIGVCGPLSLAEALKNNFYLFRLDLPSDTFPTPQVDDAITEVHGSIGRNADLQRIREHDFLSVAFKSTTIYKLPYEVKLYIISWIVGEELLGLYRSSCDLITMPCTVPRLPYQLFIHNLLPSAPVELECDPYDRIDIERVQEQCSLALRREHILRVSHCISKAIILCHRIEGIDMKSTVAMIIDIVLAKRKPVLAIEEMKDTDDSPEATTTTPTNNAAVFCHSKLDTDLKLTYQLAPPEKETQNHESVLTAAHILGVSMAVLLEMMQNPLMSKAIKKIIEIFEELYNKWQSVNNIDTPLEDYQKISAEKNGLDSHEEWLDPNNFAHNKMVDIDFML